MRDKQQQIQFQNALIPSIETIYFHIKFGNQKKTNHSMVIIYTIKTRLKYICVRIYMFICSELIEETGRPPGLIFGMCRYFWPGSDKFESWKNFHTFDGVMT